MYMLKLKKHPPDRVPGSTKVQKNRDKSLCAKLYEKKPTVQRSIEFEYIQKTYLRFSFLKLRTFCVKHLLIP
jgi:hypothetical protein